MEAPCEQKRTFYVYGFWHIYENKPLVLKDESTIELYSFDKIDEALEKLKKLSLSNINITYCLTRDKCSIDALNKRND